MTDDLVKRLRDQWEATPPDICHAAADRIEALEAALREIADEKNWTEWLGWNGDEEPQDIARAALGEKKDPERDCP
jgi:hypothetical protein